MQDHPSILRLRLVTGMAALSLILAACHGGSSGTAPYVPAGGTSFQQAVDRGITPGEEHGELFSTCGHHIHIVLLGIVNCHFHERGDRSDRVTLKNNTQGLILISPMSGNGHTKFSITGLLVGSGHFTVYDGRKNSLVVTVKVTL